MARRADGTVYINSLMDTSGFKAGSKSIESTARRMAKRVAGVLAGVFAVKELVQFGKQSVELGSALSEVQNVVDVTFGNLSKEVDDFAKNAITQFGLSETAAKQYTSTMGAMLKSMGLTTREAADMSMSMTGLAADMASFYNLDAEDAFYKIRAGISGETEPLKQLGINMSVANLEAYALSKGITKSYNAMTQQEQAVLRYNYLLSVTADAQGDFARTSESWANQTRVLSEQFKAIKATIGQGLINVLTPVLKVINTLLAKLATLANAFKSFTELITGNMSSGSTGGAAAGLVSADMADGYNQAADGAENLAGATEDAADATKKAEKAAKGYLNPLDEISKWEDNTDSLSDVLSPDTSGGSNAGEQLAGAINDVDYGALAEGETVIDKMSDSLLKVKEILTGLFKPFKEAWEKEGGATVDAALYALESIGELAKSVGKSFYDVWTNGTGTTTLTLILQIVQNILETVGNLAKRFKEAWDEAGVGTSIVQGIFDIFNIILETIEKITDATKRWAAKLDFTPLLTSIDNLLKSIQPLAQNIGDGLAWFYEHVLLPLAGFVIEDVLPAYFNLFAADLKVLNAVIEALKPLAEWLFENFLQPLAQWTGGLIISAIQGLTNTLNALGEWISGHEGIVQAFVVTLGLLVGASMVTKILSAVAALGEYVINAGGLSAVLSTLTTSIIANTTAWLANIAAQVADKAETLAIMALYAKDFVVNLASGTAALIKQAAQFAINTAAKIADAAATAAMTAATVAWNAVCTVATALTTALGAAIGFLTSPIGIAIAAIAAIIAVGVLLYKNWDTIKEKAGQLKDRIIEKFEVIRTGIIEKVEFVKEKISNAWEAVKDTTSENWEKVKTTISNTWESVKGTVTEKAKAVKDDILDKWQTIKTKTSETWGKVKTTLSDDWESIKTDSSNVFKDVKKSVTDAWKKINTNTSETWRTVTGTVSNKAQEVWDNIVDTFANIWDTMRDIGSNIINGIIDGLASAWNTLVDWAQSIFDLFSFNIGGGGGYSSGGGYVIYNAIPNTPSFPVPDIPYLAKGAVIPPNAPFAAILGDQRRGNNLELPEDLLRKIIREETGGNQQKGNSTYRFTAEINRKTLFDQMIDEAVLRQTVYGRNPFELG